MPNPTYPDDPTDLQKSRQEIDRVDKDLIRLLKERMEVVKKVAATKSQNVEGRKVTGRAYLPPGHQDTKSF